MFISFVTPFYGSSALLSRCVESLLAQTDGDFEAVIVDDCSPQDGEAVVKAFGDPRIRYLRQPKNGGPYQARQRGFREARGDYVVCVDCDDYVQPELVAEIRKTVEADAEDAPDIVVYNIETDADGKIAPHWFHYEAGVYTSEESLAALVAKKLQWSYFAKAIRREMICEIGREMPALQEASVCTVDDYCAVVPMMLKSRKTVVIPYYGYRYRETATSISRAVTFRKVRRALREVRVARDLVLAYAARIQASDASRRCVVETAEMIRRWWLGELVASVKRRIKRFFTSRARA